MANTTNQITVKGNFEKSVIINNSLVNGKECVIANHEKYSHAEGFKSSASGEYSHADGVKAEASDDRSYVWSGVDLASPPVISKGVGTFSIYTNTHPTTSTISDVYINGASLDEILKHYGEKIKESILSSNNTWTGENTFNAPITSNKTTVSGECVYTKTYDDEENTCSTTIATTDFVHKTIQKYLKCIFGEHIFNTTQETPVE